MALAALAAFLLIFLPVHMGLNLCILRDDGGEWYRNVCHFMGTNYIVKIFEIVLILCIVCHLCIALIVAIENRLSRGNVRYAVHQKTKTHAGSRYMVYTGVIIFCFLILHFINFYFAKMGLVEGKYVAKVEKVDKAFQEKAVKLQTGELKEADMMELQRQYQAIQSIPKDKTTKDFKYFVNLTKKEVQTYCGNDFTDYEPDFYNMAKDLFHHNYYVLIYVLVLIVLGIHLGHGVASVFQTFGLYNEKYSKAIETFSWIYAVVLPLGFALVPLCVFFS